MLSFLVALVTSFGFAQQCPTLNSEMAEWFMTHSKDRNKVPIVKAPIERRMGAIRDQARTPWCWAYATADLISLPLGQPVSAAHIVSITERYKGGRYDRRGRAMMEAGVHLENALDAIEGEYLCSERQVPSSKFLNGDARKATCSSPSLSIASLRFKIEKQQVGYRNSLLHAIDEALKENKVPAIEYNVVKYLTWYNPQFTKLPMMMHASTVVSRFFNPKSNQCEYIIRNSWGENCYLYNGTCAGGYHSVSRYSMGEILYQVIRQK